MTVINIFGGPGAGKSTMASELFVMMKKLGYKVELVTEFAKDLVYADDNTRLDDQLMVFAEQHHRLFRLKDKVDFVITDSPLLIAKVYNKSLNGVIFNPFVDDIFDRYDNINFVLERDDSFYQKYGRIHNLSQSKEIDNRIYNILKDREFFSIRTVEDIDEYLRLFYKGSFESIIDRKQTIYRYMQDDE